MHSLRRRGIVRLQVAMMDGKLLPLKSDIINGVDGYGITFSLEAPDFQVDISPPPPSNREPD